MHPSWKRNLLSLVFRLFRHVVRTLQNFKVFNEFDSCLSNFFHHPRRTAVANSQRRAFGAAAGAFKHPKDRTFKELWLSDKGAYPVIGIMAFASGFATWFGCRMVAAHPDVRVTPSKRTSVMRTWG